MKLARCHSGMTYMTCSCYSLPESHKHFFFLSVNIGGKNIGRQKISVDIKHQQTKILLRFELVLNFRYKVVSMLILVVKKIGKHKISLEKKYQQRKKCQQGLSQYIGIKLFSFYVNTRKKDVKLALSLMDLGCDIKVSLKLDKSHLSFVQNCQ